MKNEMNKPVWVDVNGKKYYDFTEIDNRYLTNIINFCRKGHISKLVESIEPLCDEGVKRGLLSDYEVESLVAIYNSRWNTWQERKAHVIAHYFGLDPNFDGDCVE